MEARGRIRRPGGEHPGNGLGLQVFSATTKLILSACVNTVMSNRIAIIFVVLLQLGSALGTDGERTRWTGLWRLNQQTERGPVQLHFHVPGGNAALKLYGVGWEPLAVSQSQMEGSVFLLNWQAKGVNVVFDGRRQGDRISGSWKLIHPQYSEEGRFSARRLFSDPQWSPLDAVKALGSSSRLIDLNAHLAEKISTEADFEKYWDETFRRDFLVFLAHAPSASEVRRTLEQPDFLEKAKTFASLLKELADASRLKLSGLRLSIPVVALPFGEADPEVVWVDGAPFVTVNVDRFWRQVPDSRRRAHFAEQMLKANFQFTLPNLPGDPFQLWRAGVPAYLASKSELARPEEVLAVTAEQFTALQSELPNLKEKRRAGKKLSPAERDFLAYDFVASQGGEKTPSELVEMGAQDVTKAFKSYLKP